MGWLIRRGPYRGADWGGLCKTIVVPLQIPLGSPCQHPDAPPKPTHGIHGAKSLLAFVNSHAADSNADPNMDIGGALLLADAVNTFQCIVTCFLDVVHTFVHHV